MKIVSFVLCVFSILSVGFGADLPNYEYEELTIKIPTTMGGFRPSPDDNVVSGNAFYNFTGKIFISPAVIDTTSPFVESKITPFHSLREVIEIYSSGNITNLGSMYTGSGRTKINAIVNGPNSVKFKNMMSSVGKFTVKAIIHQDDSSIVMTEVGSGVGRILPYFFKKENDKWLMSDYSSNVPMINNLLTYLMNDTLSLSGLIEN